MPPPPITIRPGERIKVRLPWSEVCMHMRVAGKVMAAELTADGSGIQLYDDEGDQFSFPITLGEAGFYRPDPSGLPYTTNAEIHA